MVLSQAIENKSKFTLANSLATEKSDLSDRMNESVKNPAIQPFNFGHHSIMNNDKIIQPKLMINEPGDPYEREADEMADKVMRMQMPDGKVNGSAGINIQRKCKRCEDEEKKMLQRKESTSQVPAVNESFDNYVNGLINGGQPLSSEVRNFYEPRFRYDFSKVRIHNNAASFRSAQSINARAYTHKNDIVFNSGQYAPDTSEGKRLLGHELTHVVQQGGGSIKNFVQRTPSSEELVEFNLRASEIRSHEVYTRLSMNSKRLVIEIIDIARTRDNWQYYLENLLLLLNTPDAPENEEEAESSIDPSSGDSPQLSTREMNEAEVSDSLSQERSRLFYPAGSGAVDSEERQTTTPPRLWTRRRGEGGRFFYVDARDPGNIYVKIKVKLNGRNVQDIANVKEMEDGIEKRVATFGYTVDLIFVDRRGRDVFDVNVDLEGWTNSGNWAGGLDALGHELHHLMGLDDRYNYIEAHASNAHMNMSDRIYWFRQQMNRSPGVNDEDSIMNNQVTGTMLTDDIAAVAGISEASIITAQNLRRNNISNARQKAAHRISIAYLRVNGTNPHFSRIDELRQVRGLIAPDIVNLEQIADILGRMLSIIRGSAIQVGPEIDSCSQWVGYVIGNRVPIHLCNRFFQVDEEQQIRTLIHESAHAVGLGESGSETYFPFYDCSFSTQDNWSSADAWARYVHCISGQNPDQGEEITAH